MGKPSRRGTRRVIMPNAGHLFGVARDAYDKTSYEPSDRFPDPGGALVAILFAAAAVEAFINELGALAEDAVARDLPAGVPDSLAAFAALASHAEASRASTEMKFLLAHAAFSGRPPDRGRAPYQDFMLLMQLRALIVHAKPTEEMREGPSSSRVFGPPRNLIRALEQRGINADFGEPDVSSTTLMWISTRAAARWACNTTAAMVQATLSLPPDSDLKDRITPDFAPFQPVEEPPPQHSPVA